MIGPCSENYLECGPSYFVGKGVRFGRSCLCAPTGLSKQVDPLTTALLVNAQKATDGRSQRRQKSADRIYDAAMELLEERSYADVSVEDICERAGVGRATFFRAYGGKDGLLRELNSRIARKIRDRLTQSGAPDLVSRLKVIGAEFAEVWSNATPGALALATDFTKSASVLEAHSIHPELLAEVIGVVREAMDQGEVDCSFPAEFVGNMALFQIAGTMAFWMENRHLDITKIMDEAVSVWAYGYVKATPQ